MATTVEFRIHESEYVQFVNDPIGPIGRELSRRAKIVEEGAKSIVPKRTGALAASIASSPPFIDSGGRSSRESRLAVSIGSELRYAYVVHEGARAYTIRPRFKSVLKFHNRGAVVYAQSVRHPKTIGRKYLTIPLRLVIDI